VCARAPAVVTSEAHAEAIHMQPSARCWLQCFLAAVFTRSLQERLARGRLVYGGGVLERGAVVGGEGLVEVHGMISFGEGMCGVRSHLEP